MIRMNNKDYVLGTKVKNLVGMKFGKLEVIEFDYGNYEEQKAKKALRLVKNCSSRFICQCECGTVKSIASSHLCNGDTKSCGCYKDNVVASNSKPKTLSFEDWCHQNNHGDYLSLWDSELNSKKASEISFSSNKKYYFKCAKGLHNSELKLLNSLTDKKRNLKLLCKKCESFGQWIIESFGESSLQEIWDYTKNDFSPFDVPKSTTKEAWFKCNNGIKRHGYKMRVREFYVGQRCPYCSGARVHKQDSFGTIYSEIISSRWSDKNVVSPLSFSCGSNAKIWLKCQYGIHEDYSTTLYDSIKREFRCPKCSMEMNESVLQNKVRLYIETLGYTTKHEHECSIRVRNTKTKTFMPFDNEIVELRLLIEVNGSQHYNLSSWHKAYANKRGITAEQVLVYQKVRDRYKQYIAWKNGYQTLVVPYWADDSEQTWKKMIDDKISIILQQK